MGACHRVNIGPALEARPSPMRPRVAAPGCLARRLTRRNWECRLAIPPELIVCLRHGESPYPMAKSAETSLVCPIGVWSDQRLAMALIAESEESPGSPRSLLPPGVGKPAHILVPRYLDGTKQHRSSQTVQPLAAAPTSLQPTRATSKMSGGSSRSFATATQLSSSAGNTTVWWPGSSGSPER
jgi:hypothetical protein